MAIVTKPMIDNLELKITRDTANAEVTITYDLNWSEVDVLTNLPYTEQWELRGVDALTSQSLYVGPTLVNGIKSNGNTSEQRTLTDTIPFADLDEDPNNADEIVAVVTLTPQLPTAKSRQSPQVVVNAP